MGNKKFILLIVSFLTSIGFNIRSFFFSSKNSRINPADVKVKYLYNNNDIDYASWVCGFTDGEGCFSVSFSKRESLKTKLEVKPSFSISQKASSRESLETMQKYFQCGSLRYSSSDNCYKYEVRSLKDINEKIIPFFNKHKLLTLKKQDFEKFVEICSDMKRGMHLNITGIKKIVKTACEMNPSGKRKYSYDQLMQILLTAEKKNKTNNDS
jgi:LAGLIDADG endonuclease